MSSMDVDPRDGRSMEYGAQYGVAESFNRQDRPPFFKGYIFRPSWSNLVLNSARQTGPDLAYGARLRISFISEFF